MKQDLKWFKDREMDQIIMITPEGKEVTSDVRHEKDANYYFDLQEKGFTFKPVIRIHKTAPTGCASCEG